MAKMVNKGRTGVATSEGYVAFVDGLGSRSLGGVGEPPAIALIAAAQGHRWQTAGMASFYCIATGHLGAGSGSVPDRSGKLFIFRLDPREESVMKGVYGLVQVYLSSLLYAHLSFT